MLVSPLFFHSDILSPLFCCGFSATEEPFWGRTTKNLSQKCQCASQRITSQSLLEDGFRDGTYDKKDPGGVYIFKKKKKKTVFLNLSCTQAELLTSCLNRLAKHSCRCNSSSGVFDWSFRTQQTGWATDRALTWRPPQLRLLCSHAHLHSLCGIIVHICCNISFTQTSHGLCSISVTPSGLLLQHHSLNHHIWDSFVFLTFLALKQSSRYQSCDW